jgi:hypothetical protein
VGDLRRRNLVPLARKMAAITLKRSFILSKSGAKKNCQICNSSSAEAALRALISSTEYALTFFSVYLCRKVTLVMPCARRKVTTLPKRFAMVWSA